MNGGRSMILVNILFLTHIKISVYVDAGTTNVAATVIAQIVTATTQMWRVSIQFRLFKHTPMLIY